MFRSVALFLFLAASMVSAQEATTTDGEEVIYRCANGLEARVQTDLPKTCEHYEQDEFGDDAKVCCDRNVKLDTIDQQTASGCGSLGDECLELLELYDCGVKCSKLQAEFTKKGDTPTENSVRICRDFSERIWTACQEETMGRLARFDPLGQPQYECVVLEEEYEDAQAFVTFFLGDEYVEGTRRCLNSGSYLVPAISAFAISMFALL